MLLHLLLQESVALLRVERVGDVHVQERVVGVQLHVQRQVVHDILGAVQRHTAQLQVQRVVLAAEAQLDGVAVGGERGAPRHAACHVAHGDGAVPPVRRLQRE